MGRSRMQWTCESSYFTIHKAHCENCLISGVNHSLDSWVFVSADQCSSLYIATTNTSMVWWVFSFSVRIMWGVLCAGSLATSNHRGGNQLYGSWTLTIICMWLDTRMSSQRMISKWYAFYVVVDLLMMHAYLLKYMDNRLAVSRITYSWNNINFANTRYQIWNIFKYFTIGTDQARCRQWI